MQERAVQAQTACIVAHPAVRSDRPGWGGRSPTGGRGSGGSAPVRGIASSSVAFASRSRTSNPVRAARPSVASTVTRAARRPSGASTANASCSTVPRTSARYRRSMAWTLNISTSARCASSSFATIIRPDVPASRRWTIPGRIGPFTEERGTPIPSRRFTSVPVRRRSRGMGDHPGGLRDDQQVFVLPANRNTVDLRRRAALPPSARPRCARRPGDGGIGGAGTRLPGPRRPRSRAERPRATAR